jgi:hypothetical protein
MAMNHRDDAWLAELRAAFSAAELIEPPDWVRERAKRAFRSRAISAAPAILDRVRASLLFDSRQRGLSPAGVRSYGVLDVVREGPWQLLYRGGNVDVDLLVRPNKDGHTMNVRGQALTLGGDSVGLGIVEALPAHLPRTVHGPKTLPSATTNVDASGEFAISNLERGRYDVLLRFGAHEIELSDVEL